MRIHLSAWSRQVIIKSPAAGMRIHLSAWSRQAVIKRLAAAYFTTSLTVVTVLFPVILIM
jgi:hypothetical protein